MYISNGLPSQSHVQAVFSAPQYENNSVVQKCIEKMADEFNFPVDAIKLKFVEAVTWSNSGLGCAKPNEIVLMVLTPGYKITLDYAGHSYIFHTNSSGSAIRLAHS